MEWTIDFCTLQIFIWPGLKSRACKAAICSQSGPDVKIGLQAFPSFSSSSICWRSGYEFRFTSSDLLDLIVLSLADTGNTPMPICSRNCMANVAIDEVRQTTSESELWRGRCIWLLLREQIRVGHDNRRVRKWYCCCLILQPVQFPFIPEMWTHFLRVCCTKLQHPFSDISYWAAGADLRTVGVNTSRRKTLDRTLGVVTRKEAEGRP